MKTIILLLAILCGPAFAQTTTFKGELRVQGNWTNTKVYGSTIRESIGDLMSYENFGIAGTNALYKGDMTKLIVKKGTLTNNVDITYNLASVSNSFGDLQTFTKVKFIALYVYPSATETNCVYQLGGGASDSFQHPFGVATGYAKVTSGGFYMMLAPNYTGYPVGSTTNLYLKNISTGAATNTPYVLYVGGE